MHGPAIRAPILWDAGRPNALYKLQVRGGIIRAKLQSMRLADCPGLYFSLHRLYTPSKDIFRQGLGLTGCNSTPSASSSLGRGRRPADNAIRLRRFKVVVVFYGEYL